MQPNSLRIVFMGTPEFAVASLEALVNAGFNIVGVVTTPDRPAGRGLKIQESAVKQYAKTLNVPILQPEKLKDPVFIEQLTSLQANLQVVVAFRMLPEQVWNMPQFGTINLHGSLLPHYRGAAPINWAVINGDAETGLTTFFIEKEIDTGKIIFADRLPIGPDENAGHLHDRMKEAGGKLLVKTLQAIEAGTYPQIPQSDLINPGETLKPAPKIFKEDCKINWNQSIDKIYNHIRGLSPYPAAWSTLKAKSSETELTFKLFESEKELSNHSLQVGEIVSDSKKYLKIAVNRGYINITSLQLEGKKRLSAEELLRGFKVSDFSLKIE
ncbi:MAG TPA: methionyl-tRNA formyltransferase [Bacteroidales bacterium]|nr:methionyl-tRNA formyltransferase [Bacteroidales bacterium]